MLVLAPDVMEVPAIGVTRMLAVIRQLGNPVLATACVNLTISGCVERSSPGNGQRTKKAESASS